LSIAPVEGPATETVVMPKPTDLRRVAEWTDTSVELLQELNPELRRWTTPVKATDYSLRVPMGAAARVVAQLTNVDQGDLVNLSWYTVKKGDTLLSIARKLKVNRADLADANYLSAKAKVASGQQLVIPRAPTTLLAARTEPAEVTARGKAEADVVAATATPSGPTVYRVKPGDTLSGISRQFDVSVASLKSWNNLRGNNIQVGQRLRLHPTTAVRATR
jgi:membrane-bound lytic murein transglycosylase D